MFPLKLWYSYTGNRYTEKKGFYDTSQLEWTKLIEDNYLLIRDEIYAFLELNKHRLIPYLNKDLLSGPDKWKALSFIFWDMYIDVNAEVIPKTLEVLKGVPGLTGLSLSLLEPGAEIKRHRGDTNATVRCHLPLEVPGELPQCGFKVGDDEISWKEGRLIVFNDAAIHEAWNLTEKQRLVLIIDVFRPEFLDNRKSVCSHVLTDIFWQWFSGRKPMMAKIPRLIRNLLVYPLIRMIYQPEYLFRKMYTS